MSTTDVNSPAIRREQTAKVAERMRLARRLAGLTQEDAAKELGVTVRTYARWENAETSGFLAVLDRIAELFDTEPDQLLGPEDVTEGTLEAKIDALLAQVAELRDLVVEALEREGARA